MSLNEWRFGRVFMLRSAAVVILFGGASCANADQYGVQIAGGFGDHGVDKIDLGFAWDPGLKWWDFGGWHMTLIGEAHAAYWFTSGEMHNTVWEFGVTPILRYIKDSGAFRPYIEAGAGLRGLTHPTVNSTYSLSSAFQFTEVVGVGVQFGGHQQYQIGYRFQHISNADIKRPNPGIDFNQVYVQYNF
jgi:hypothetical protein